MRISCKSFSIATFFFCFSYLQAEQEPSFPPPRRATLRHIESGGVGYTSGYTTLELFLGADPNTWKITPFFDGRGHIFDNGTWAANGGIGLRGKLGERIYGVNAYYDYRGTKHLDYQQASIGFETLGTFFDARMNGYLPFGKKISSPYDTKFGYFSGHYLFLSQKVELAMKGIDAEAGFHLGNCDAWSFQANAGPYYFHGAFGTNAWGGKIRAGVSYRDWVTFEIIESYDNVFHNNVQGQIGFSISLGAKREVRQVERLYCRQIQPVARNEIIVLDQKRRHPKAINPETGLPYFFLFVNNTSSSLGTFESPYPSLTLAQNNSAPNQIIYVFPGDGTTTNMDQGITLQASQKFWGSGIAHPLQTGQGLITVSQMSTTSPQITNSNDKQPGATLSTNNEISGITFTHTSGGAIVGVDPGTFSLSSCVLTACGQGDSGIFPVFLETSNPLNAAIVGNTFTENPNAGILVKLLPGASSSQITMNNNQAYNNDVSSGSAAIMNLEAHGAIGACELVMRNNIFQNNACGGCNITDFDSPHEGSFTAFEGIFDGNIFAEGAQGITFATNAESCKMTIQNNDLSNNSSGSILVTNGAAGTQSIQNATIAIVSNQINEGGNAGDAITISPAGDTLSLTLAKNTIENNAGTGFVSYFNTPGPSLTLQISNNSIKNNLNPFSNAAGGISVDGFSSLSATVANNKFSNNQQGNAIGRNGASVITPDTSSVTFTDNQLTEGDTFEFAFYGADPSTGCLTISGNTGAATPTYSFQQQGSGACFIVPCNYEAENTGVVELINTVTPSANCSGDACPAP